MTKGQNNLGRNLAGLDLVAAPGKMHVELADGAAPVGFVAVGLELPGLRGPAGVADEVAAGEDDALLPGVVGKLGGVVARGDEELAGSADSTVDERVGTLLTVEDRGLDLAPEGDGLGEMSHRIC